MNQIEKSRIDEILKLHKELKSIGRKGFTLAMRLGELLIDTKKEIKHGRWNIWLKNNLSDIDERTAQRYMNLYRHRDILKNDSVSDLNSAYKLIANIKEFDKVADDLGLPGHKKDKIKKSITPNMDKEAVEMLVNISIPKDTKKRMNEKKQTEEQGRYIENRIKEMRREMDGLTSKFTRLKDVLKSLELKWITGIEIRQLLISKKRFDVTYQSLCKFIDDKDEEEILPTKKIQIIETNFPRIELPAAFESEG